MVITLNADVVQYATSFLQSLYYRVAIPAGQPHPRPGTPLYAHHHRRIRVLVLSLYLVYTFAQALYDIKLAGDFYTMLGVTTTSTERDIKARFRRLAARYHPDKVRESDLPSMSAETAYVQFKLAHDTILDPAKRFAYDRFGPVIVQVDHPGLKNIRDYVYAGLRSKVPEYVISAFSLAVLNMIWLPKWGSYWRYLAIASLAFLELYFLTHAWSPPPVVAQLASGVHRILPQGTPSHLLPFQTLALARKLSLSLNIFISQLAPSGARSKADQDQQTQQQLAHLVDVANRTDAEAGGILQMGFAPFKNDTQRARALRTGMKDDILTGAVRNSPEVREAVRRVIDRRKEHQETMATGSRISDEYN